MKPPVRILAAHNTEFYLKTYLSNLIYPVSSCVPQRGLLTPRLPGVDSR